MGSRPGRSPGFPLIASLRLDRTVRIGVTGLARAGKTSFLTSLGANLLALGAGVPCLPALQVPTLQGVRLAPAGASEMPRFDIGRHLAALAADPPAWPERTESVGLLALELSFGRGAVPLPPRRLRLEFLDYPGEWLLDLPLLRLSYADWSAATLRRLEGQEQAIEFLRFAEALPARAAADETLASTGQRLYRACLLRLRDEAGLSMLQPGRFLMPPPGAEPPWMGFFPARAGGAFGELLARRYAAYVEQVRAELVSPLFGSVDRIVVLADLLSALHAGPAAFGDARAALAAAAAALRWQVSWEELLGQLAQLRLPKVIRRVAFAATKSDHVAERQRGNLAALVGGLTGQPGRVVEGRFAIAAVRCTEDIVWTLDGHPVSAVRGRALGEATLTRSYPGEVPAQVPDEGAPEAGFWAHRFLALPRFEPLRLPEGGRGGVASLGLDRLLAFLLEDVL